MKTKKAFFIFIALLAAGCSFAQTGALKFKALQFNTVNIPFPFSGNLKNSASADVISFFSETHAPAMVDPVVHYPAFFCRMELKSVDQLGIWIKIHAGDYDTYSRCNSTH